MKVVYNIILNQSHDVFNLDIVTSRPMRNEYTKEHWRPKREVQFGSLDDILVFAEEFGGLK